MTHEILCKVFSTMLLRLKDVVTIVLNIKYLLNSGFENNGKFGLILPITVLHEDVFDVKYFMLIIVTSGVNIIALKRQEMPLMWRQSRGNSKKQ